MTNTLAAFSRALFSASLFITAIVYADPVVSEPSYFAGPYWRNLWAGTKTAYTGPHLAGMALIGLPVTAVVHNQDDWIQAEVQQHKPLGDDWAEVGHVLGSVYTHAGIMGGTYLYGRLSERPALIETSVQMLEGWSIASASVLIIKPIAGRERPDGSDNFSFPSYHAAGSFALATTAQLRHGPWIGVPAYAGAAFIAFSRIESNKHHASDVFFGTCLGINAAHAVWQVHRKVNDPNTKVTFSPQGVLVVHRF